MSTENNETIEQSQTESKKRDVSKIWNIAILLFLIFSTSFLIARQTGGSERGSLFDPNATEKVAVLPVERPGSIDIPGYPQVIKLDAGKSVSYIDLHNPETNEAYLRFSILINDSDGESEVIYESGLVKPGYTINEQPLSRSLDAGLYDATIAIQTYMYDEESGDVFELNGVRNQLSFDVSD